MKLTEVTNKMGIIPITWLVFAIIFISLGVYHWNASKNNINPFPIPQSNNIDKNTSQALMQFGNIINSHVCKLNKSSKSQNIIAALGYWAAAATAVFSVFLAWPRSQNHCNKDK